MCLHLVSNENPREGSLPLTIKGDVEELWGVAPAEKGELATREGEREGV